MARWITRWKPSQVLAQLIHVGAAGAQDFGRRGVVEQRQQ
jgi:hypothetical protein